MLRFLLSYHCLHGQLVFFRVADAIWGEEVLFSTTKRAILTYIISISLAFILTVVGYLIILYIQMKF